MTWVFWLIGYLLLLACVLLFFAGISSSERMDDDDGTYGMQPPRPRRPGHGGAGPSQLELSLDRADGNALQSPPAT